MTAPDRGTARQCASRLARAVESILVVVALVPMTLVIVWAALIELQVVTSAPGDDIVAASLLMIAGGAAFLLAIGTLIRRAVTRFGPSPRSSPPESTDGREDSGGRYRITTVLALVVVTGPVYTVGWSMFARQVEVGFQFAPLVLFWLAGFLLALVVVTQRCREQTG